jgi:hypothetical protein
MDITVVEVKTKSQLEEFLKLPVELNKDYKIFVPSLLSTERAFHDPEKNSYLKQSDTIKFLAYQNDQCVGRVMGIIFHPWNKKYNKRSARFYQLDYIHSIDVSRSLMHAIEEWAKSKGMDELVGPLGFTNRRQQGFQIEGIAQFPVWEASCQITHVPLFIHDTKEEIWYDLFSYSINIPKTDPESLCRIKERTITRGNYKLLHFKNKNEITPWLEPMRELINRSNKKLYGFWPIDKDEMHEFIHGELPIINTNFIKVVINSKLELVAFVIAHPNIGKGMQKSKGLVNLISKINIRNSLKKSKRLDLLMGAIDENCRGMGIDALIAISLFDEARKYAIENIDSNLIHEANRQMRLEMLKLGGKHYKMYRVFGKKLSATQG